MVCRPGGLPALLLAGHLILAAAAASAQPQPDPPAGTADLPPGVHGPVRGGPSPQAVFAEAMARLGESEGVWWARHAAQIETESSWRVRAESPWAQGLAQFTAPTRGDVWPRVPGCAAADPFDPWCNTLAMHAYMESLLRSSTRLTGDRRTALAVARKSYNGGLGWQQREHRLCLATPGCDPARPDHLAALCREAGRSESACRENHAYAAKVARAEPKYRRKRGIGRKILRGVAIGAAVAQGRVPDLK